MKTAIMLVFVLIGTAQAQWKVISSGTAVTVSNSDTVTSRSQVISDSAATQRWHLATTGAVHGTVRIYTLSGGTSGIRSARFTTMDSVSASGPYSKVLGPLTLDSLMEQDLEDKPKNPSHSITKQIPQYFYYVVEFHSKSSGNTNARVTLSKEE